MGLTLFLIVLLLSDNSRNCLHLKTQESRLSSEPAAVYKELCAYPKAHELSDGYEEAYYHLLLYRAIAENDWTLLPPDSVIVQRGIACKQRAELSLYAGYLNLLGDIHWKRGKGEAAISFYQQSIAAGRASCRSMEKAQNRKRVFYLLAVTAVGIFAAIFGGLSYRKNMELARKARARLFLQKKYENSRQYVESNLKTIASLTEQLESLSHETAMKEIHYLQMQRENLGIRNKEQEIKKSRISTSLLLIRKSDCAGKFYKAAVDGRILLTKKNWDELAQLATHEFPVLMNRLEQISHITPTERKVCLLMLLDVGTLEMASIVRLGTSSVSNAKKSLYEKLTGLKGSAKDLSQEIINIIST